MNDTERKPPPPSLEAIERGLEYRIEAIQASLDELPRLSKALAALRGVEYVAPPDSKLPEHLRAKVRQAIDAETADLRGQLDAVTQRSIMLERRIDEERKDDAFKEEERQKLRRQAVEQGAEIRDLKQRLQAVITQRDEALKLLDGATAPAQPPLEAPEEPERPLKDEEGKWRGGTVQLVKPEQVRDVIQQNLRKEPFRLGQVMPFFPDVSDQTIKRRISELVERGVLRTIGRGAGTKYAYVKPTSSEPVSRRNVEAEVMREAGVGSQSAKRGQIVPHTKAEGTSHKPGLDKKRSAKGIRVKRERQGT